MKSTLGSNIKKIRLGKELTQENMAFELGITKSAYSKIEREETNVSINRLRAIANIFEVELVEFFKDPKTPSILEEPKTQYGFATKNDFEELVNMIKEVTQEVHLLKATVETLTEIKVKLSPRT